MTWRSDNQQIDEVAKVRWDLVPYMRGQAIDLGCGPSKAFPHFIGVDSGKDTELFGIQMKPNVVSDVTNLSMFASNEFDCVVSSHTLEHVEDYVATLREWWRLVRVGGYLCLYLPHRDLYPQCSGRDEWRMFHKEHGGTMAEAVDALVKKRTAEGKTTVGAAYAGTPFANPDHKHDFAPEDIIAAMKSIGGGFDLVENETRDGGDEYSFWQVYKKIPSGVRESWKAPRPAKTVGIVRYGAIGDMIQASSVLPWFKEQGYHVTLYCQSGNGYETIKHDPHVDRFIVQDKDAVPAHALSAFWGHERKKYTKWVNFSESVEGTLLACPDRVQWEWPNEVRAKYLDRNYLEWMHELADVPPPYRPAFYSTPEETQWAKKQAASWGKRNIVWSLTGSSGHKAWPHLDPVIAAILDQYRDVHVVLVGDDTASILEQGWEKEPRVHRTCGKWTIRQSLAFCEVADIIIGCETGLLNAAGAMPAHKIINLSHSSEEMLTKHWVNTTVLRQPEGVGCNKQPCRQLHGSNGFDNWLDCPRAGPEMGDADGAALCQAHITPDMMWQAVRRVLGEPVFFQQRRAA